MAQSPFHGTSEMARRMRALDWSQHAARPGRAVAAVAAHLGQHLPRLRLPHRALVGTRARHSLQRRIRADPRSGQASGRARRSRGAKVWAEIWDVIGPMLSQVMATARADPLARPAAAHRPRLPRRGLLLVFLQPDPRRGRRGRRRLLPGHRNHRESHRRAPAAHAARPGGAAPKGAESEDDGLRRGGRDARRRTRTTCRSRCIYRVDDQGTAERDRRRDRHRARRRRVARTRRARRHRRPVV